MRERVPVSEGEKGSQASNCQKQKELDRDSVSLFHLEACSHPTLLRVCSDLFGMRPPVLQPGPPVPP